MSAPSPVDQYRHEQQALERQRTEEKAREKLADNDFIRAMFEMIYPGAKR